MESIDIDTSSNKHSSQDDHAISSTIPVASIPNSTGSPNSGALVDLAKKALRVITNDESVVVSPLWLDAAVAKR